MFNWCWGCQKIHVANKLKYNTELKKYRFNLCKWEKFVVVAVLSCNLNADEVEALHSTWLLKCVCNDRAVGGSVDLGDKSADQFFAASLRHIWQ